jgi:hypothetical protein
MPDIRVDRQLIVVALFLGLRKTFGTLLISRKKGGFSVNKLILPAVCAVAMLVLLSIVNEEPEAAGYAIAILIGLIIGAFLNKLFFKEKSTADFAQVTKPIVNKDDKAA